ncbi:hypothetical protein [Parasitella parasitica]|uniref:Inhibitor of growth protein N-terminal histone-binding domain-containing protein n=1 Tax=Parasitella parasitica TaxID=35722 RepID=A0A0B7NT66_9FUNG|nr:hypothetical protein [Parasitella parasitica]
MSPFRLGLTGKKESLLCLAGKTRELIASELNGTLELLDDKNGGLSTNDMSKSISIKHYLNVLERFIQLKALVLLLEETAQRSSEKAALAKLTLDAVDRHCNRLDADLVKYEETHPIGTLRIASLPGLTPSSQSLREYSKLSSKEKISKKIIEKSQSAKKRRVAKDELGLPRVLKEQARSRNSQDKGKPIKTLPPRKNNGKLKSSDSEPIDPNEQLYCYCQQVSFGEMVACDNKEVGLFGYQFYDYCTDSR